MKVAVVILNWNGEDYLKKFLPAVFANCPEYAEVYLADNASTDNSVPIVRKEFPSVHIIQNATNGGYAMGYNEALSKISAEYFVLLNSDVQVSQGWIEPIIELMESDRTVAACQPKILSFHQPNHFEYAGAAGGFIDRFGYAFCRGRLFDYVEEDTKQYENTTEIFWASGACMFVRADYFRSAGGLDEDFFAHMEEIDLCWRMKIQGHKIMYCPKSTVYHVGGGTLSKINPRKTYLNFRNNLFLLAKNLPRPYLFRMLLLRLVLDGVAGIKFLFEGNAKHCFAVLKAHFHFYGGLRKMLKKRNEAQIASNLVLSGVYTESIVWEYFVKKNKNSNLSL